MKIEIRFLKSKISKDKYAAISIYNNNYGNYTNIDLRKHFSKYYSANFLRDNHIIGDKILELAKKLIADLGEMAK